MIKKRIVITQKDINNSINWKQLNPHAPAHRHDPLGFAVKRTFKTDNVTIGYTAFAVANETYITEDERSRDIVDNFITGKYELIKPVQLVFTKS